MRDLTAAIVGGAIATALAGTVASGASETGGVIQGCYSSGGSLKIVEALPCPQGQTPLTWNRQGNPGPARPAERTESTVRTARV
jgi:hypothetical protein